MMWYIYGYVALGLFAYGTFLDEDGPPSSGIVLGILWPIFLPVRLGAMFRLLLGRNP